MDRGTLVISRRVGETLHLGDHITVQVTAVRGGQVRLAVCAPREVRVLREELLHAAQNDATPPWEA